VSAGEAPKPAVVISHKPGLCARIFAPLGAKAAGLKPKWNLRTFVIGLLVLIVLALIAENWAAMRLSLFGLHCDVPKAIVLVAIFAIGFAAAWLTLRRKPAQAGE
jgi:uncharacterized integral membrane protein